MLYEVITKYSTLKGWGFNSPVDVSVYGNGGYMLSKVNSASFATDLNQNVIWHGEDGDNDDCLFFYSTGITKWSYDEDQDVFEHESNDYADKAFYYLSDQGEPKLVIQSAVETSAVTDEVSSYAYYQLYEADLVNLIQSGRVWYGDSFQSGRSINYTFPISEVVDGASLNVFVKAAGRASVGSAFSIYWNGTQAGTISFGSVDTGSKLTEYARTGESRFIVSTSLASSILKLSFNSSSSSATGWLDCIELNYRRKLSFEDTELLFRNPASVGDRRVSRYTIANVSSVV